MDIVGCDMPFISVDAAKVMAEVCRETNMDAVIPEIEGRLHPLHGIYLRKLGLKAEPMLQQQNYRLIGLLEHLDWQSGRVGFLRATRAPNEFRHEILIHKNMMEMSENLPL